MGMRYFQIQKYSILKILKGCMNINNYLIAFLKKNVFIVLPYDNIIIL